MQYYEFYLSCGFSFVRESKYLAFPDNWSRADIKYVFEDEVKKYAEKHGDIGCLPKPKDFYYKQDYEEKYDEAYNDWVYEVRHNSSIENSDVDEWKTHNGITMF